MEKSIIRFWENVEKRGTDECWPWIGRKQVPNPCGLQYGQFQILSRGKTKNYRAHRFSYMLTNGIIPEGLVIMHHCDNPLCVNPAHLSAVTQYENCQDQVAKGRQNQGETHGISKLNDDLVMQIRESTKPDSEWAEELSLHVSTIYNARTGKRWSHVPFPPALRQREESK